MLKPIGKRLTRWQMDRRLCRVMLRAARRGVYGQRNEYRNITRVLGRTLSDATAENHGALRRNNLGILAWPKR